MWRELLLTLGLMLILEGVLPFLNPTAFRELLTRATRLEDAALRLLGLSLMLVGALLVQAFG